MEKAELDKKYSKKMKILYEHQLEGQVKVKDDIEKFMEKIERNKLDIGKYRSELSKNLRNLERSIPRLSVDISICGYHNCDHVWYEGKARSSRRNIACLRCGFRPCAFEESLDDETSTMISSGSAANDSSTEYLFLIGIDTEEKDKELINKYPFINNLIKDGTYINSAAKTIVPDINRIYGEDIKSEHFSRLFAERLNGYIPPRRTKESRYRKNSLSE